MSRHVTTAVSFVWPLAVGFAAAYWFARREKQIGKHSERRF